MPTFVFFRNGKRVSAITQYFCACYFIRIAIHVCISIVAQKTVIVFDCGRTFKVLHVVLQIRQRIESHSDNSGIQAWLILLKC